MSLKWPAKDPDEILEYSVDWSRFIGDDTISAVNWHVDDSDGTKTSITANQTVNGLKLTAQSNTTTVATAQWADGTVNTTYNVTCSITYGSNSLVAERTIKLPIKER